MTESDVALNITKLKTVKIKVIANASINFLAQHINMAIKHPEFFDIDYEKYGKDIINKSNISQSEKDRIHEMFKNPPPKNSPPSNCISQINKTESCQSPSNTSSIILEIPEKVKLKDEKNAISNNNQNILKKNNKNKLFLSPLFYVEFPDDDFNINDNDNSDNNHTVDNDFSDSSDFTEYVDEEFLDLEFYQIQEKIYKGNYISIFKIVDLKTNKIYAAKQVRFNIIGYVRSVLLDFAQEVNTSLKLIHPSIIKCIGYSPTSLKGKDKQVIVYEYAHNKSLDLLFDSIRNNKKIVEWNDTKRLINIYGIASAMSFMHSNRMIHCNLQPNNILLDENFYPKICDFDSSKKVTREIQMNDSLLRGSPAYIAPEIYFGLKYSKATDVYSFAYIVYELMTNDKPFNNINDGFEIMKMACQQKIRPEFQKPIDKNYQQLIEKCWSDNPDDRPTFSDIITQLETNEKFITKNIDKEEYYKYIKYIKESEQQFRFNEHIYELDKYIEDDSKRFDANKVKDNTKDFTLEPFNIEEELVGKYNSLLSQNYKESDSDDEYENDYQYENTEDIKLDIKDISRNELINFCNENNILIKINHFLLNKNAKNEEISLANIEYYAKSYTERYDFRYKYKEMWGATTKLIIMYGIAAGMEYLHSHNIIHRDLKPFNVITDYFWTPEIRGFDLSIMTNNKEGKIIMDEIQGTPAYLSPEVYLKKEYSKKSDVYSYGLLIYEILTEMKPFDEYSNANEIKNEICNKKRRPEFKQPINETYRHLIERCWSQKPEDRPTFSEILTELETNEDFITYQVDKESYLKYVSFIKGLKLRFYAENKLQEIDDYLTFKYKSFPDVKININLNDAFTTETINIDYSKNIYINLKKYKKEKNLYDGSDFTFFLIKNKETDIVYAAKNPYYTISGLYQHQFTNFFNELNVILQLDHPAILKFIGFSPVDFKKSQVPLIVTEYASNGSLSKSIKSKKIKDFNETKKLIILYGVAAAMVYLHSHNILHRDLKTENIYLDSSFLPKITGFDLSIMTNNKEGKIIMDEIQGTPAYLSPEVYLKKEYSKKSDVYSYGLLIYEILTEMRPFDEYSNANEIKNEICNKKRRPEFKQPINETYRHLIELCWSQKPEDRPTFTEILTELESNEKFITNKINKEEYLNYIKLIKSTKSTFNSSNQIDNLDKYIKFNLVRHKKLNNNIITRGIYNTETNSICLNYYYKNTNKLLKKMFIANEEYHKSYEFFDKEKNVYYIGRIGKQKIFNSNILLSRFSKEIETFSKLKHPAINQFEGFSMFDNKGNPRQIIFSQNAINKTLYNIIEAENEGYEIKVYDDTKRLITMYGVASAMKYIHEHNIIFRNLRPENILLDEFLYPKVEFVFQYLYYYGIDERVNIYLDPSIEYNDYTQSSDVSTFALIMYEVLMGKKIHFNVKTEEDIIKMLKYEERPRFDEYGPSKVPKVFQDLLERCWAPEASERPSFSEIVNELKTNSNYITNTINKNEYYKYIQYVEGNKMNLEKEFDKYEIEFPRVIKQSKFLANLQPLDLSNYEKVCQIGKGGFGSVYKVIDKRTGDVLAAKVSIYELDECDYESVQNLSREVEIISQLNHPAILKYIGYNPFNFKSKRKPTIITEFAHNGSLDVIIDLERKGLAMDGWDDTKKLINIYGIAAGMYYLHEKSIIHRDLKPANIFMDEFLYPKIGDFGLSRDYESTNLVINLSAMHVTKSPVRLSEENISHEASGFKGTFAYSAPEILKKEKYTEKGDVFAFGMIVYEIVTNEILYKNMNRYDILQKINEGYRHEFKFPIPYSYKKLIQKCWSQHPDERPSFREIILNIENDPGFITENIDKDDFLNYIDYVKQINYNPATSASQVKIINNESKSNSNQNHNKVTENESKSTQNLFLDLNKYQKLNDISKGDYYKIIKVQENKDKTVYAAKESIMKSSKLSDSDSIELSNELKSISNINYPSLLKFIGYSPVNFKKESKPVFITEITANGTLNQVLKAERKGNSLSGWNDTKKLINIYGIAKGMAYLHSHDILHKDLKTESIYLDKNLYPKVGDYGIPKKVSVIESLSYQTTSGLKGTPAYSAPETLLSYIYSKAGDVYSYAFIVYELMCNEIPFKNMSINQIFTEVIEGHRPEFYKSIPECYQHLIEKCWDNDANERPSFDEIVDHLKTEKEFLTDTIDKDEFIAYVKYIDNYK